MTPCKRQPAGRRPWIRGLSRLLIALGCAGIACCTTQAQPQTAPHIGYVYPAGGRQDTSFLVTVGGQFLGGVTNALISGAGVQASFLEVNRPMNPKEFNELRDELRALQTRHAAAMRRPNRRAESASPNATNVWTADDQKRADDLRARLLKNPPNRQGNPAIAEAATLKLTVAADAEPGARELRLCATNGLSNPLRFEVGQLHEQSRPHTRLPNPDIERFRERLGQKPETNQPNAAKAITLPACLNGQMMPGAVDRYRFYATRGQQIVVRVSARELIPYLADAVPGWFQAAAAITDAKGEELAYADDFRFHPDPVLRCVIPRDGDYVLEIKDAIYRGREDFVYRVTIGELPFVTGIFPLGGQAGRPTPIEVSGWNLPTNRTAPEVGFAASGLQRFRIPGAAGPANERPFAVDTFPELREHEPNDAPAQAGSVTLPCVINGRIGARGDRDVFRFEGRAGEEILAEVLARRLDSPLDSVLTLTDAAGQTVAANDDHEDKGSGLDTHHADSYLRLKLPASGAYFVQIADAQGQAGPEFAYRLRLSAPRPDFELRTAPASLNLRAGTTVPVTVYALRRDGFTNAINLRLTNAPAGFLLGGAAIPANQDQVRITLTAPLEIPPEPARLRVVGEAGVAGETLVREAVPAEDLMQAFAYRHLVPAQEWRVAIVGRMAQRNPVRILGATPVRLVPGRTTRVRIGLPAKAMRDRFDLELNDPPAGVTLQGVEPAGPLASDLVLDCDATQLRSGQAGNLIISAYAAGRAKDKPADKQRRFLLTCLPAIPFEVGSAP